MPPLPVLEDCWRITWNFRHPTQPTFHNVIHFGSDAANELILSALIESALDGNYPEMFAALPDDYGMADWDILALDGISSTVHVEIGNHGGQQTGDSIVAPAALIQLKTGFRGPSRRGRIFLGPVAEAAQNDGFLTSGVRSDTEEGWRQFNDDLLLNVSPSVGMQVASYTLPEAFAVTAIDVPAALGTQRRRQKRLM